MGLNVKVPTKVKQFATFGSGSGYAVGASSEARTSSSLERKGKGPRGERSGELKLWLGRLNGRATCLFWGFVPIYSHFVVIGFEFF
uniref:Uncharacterized protein n=1 Tax=Nelumbo nucifera TaxID=4432 RepID=A0A822YHK5_NELNU|nr:TPA_asm: hypothetical protein HUJ06_009257 [Nelumbo nucifera]